jgi:Domain of unknown function (DUF6602)
VNGKVSGQCDILIVDLSSQPSGKKDYRAVYGVIEVKSDLDASQLRQAWEHIARVKTLPNAAYFPTRSDGRVSMYGRHWRYVPTAGMVFAI